MDYIFHVFQRIPRIKTRFRIAVKLSDSRETELFGGKRPEATSLVVEALIENPDERDNGCKFDNNGCKLLRNSKALLYDTMMDSAKLKPVKWKC